MSTHRLHQDPSTHYFITFTCYRWLNLLEESGIYDYLHFWFEKLKEKGCLLNGYVVMPNHMHLVVYYKNDKDSLNKIVSESKRFLAYEIVKRLKRRGKTGILRILKEGVQQSKKTKGKQHQVFRLSFGAKVITEKEIEEVLDYVHKNPVSGVWQLVSDYVEYKYSSACYYELGQEPFYNLIDFREVASESSSSDSE